MVTTTYEVIDMVAAIGMGAPDTEWRSVDDDYDYWDYVKGIWRCEDGVPVEFIGDDGGEPEDQTLGRDWKWVAPALAAAHERGKTAAGTA